FFPHLLTLLKFASPTPEGQHTAAPPFFAECNPPFGWVKSSSMMKSPFGDEIRLDGGWVDFIPSFFKK
ncbi:MAG: hypothetical protein II272_00965, partial [Oscillospiraceae bacterium]|nr:hypothetical protein [Oscillospiraceae bacterium]